MLASDAILASEREAVPRCSLGALIADATHALFAGLRWFDLHPTVTLVLAQGYPATGLGAAYMNRLLKSAGNEHFNPENVK